MKKITVTQFALNDLTQAELVQINGGDNVTQNIFNWLGQLYATYQNSNELIGNNYQKYGGPFIG